jgi:isocitrate dehydrogenase (NAD+)
VCDRIWKRLSNTAATEPCGPEDGEVRCQRRNRQGEGVSLTHTITLIPGDGTGPEIVEATRRAIEATGVKIDWDVHEIGMPAMAKHGTPFPKEALESVRRNRVALKGPLTTELGTGFRSVNVALRKEFDLYANLRPAKTYPGVPAPRGDVDLVVVRENIEDLYAGIEFDVDSPEEREVQTVIERVGKAKIREHSALAIKAISVEGSRRIVKFAFDYARANKRKKVTAIHKANIMKFADGLFLRVAGEVAKDYPEIQFEDRIVDNMCMQLVVKPDLYDVLVAPNLYGDIVSDLVAGLVGGLGVAPGANIGENGVAMFEAIHGSAPKYAGLNKVNPMALMLAGMLMLRHIGEREAGDRLERAIAAVVAEGKEVTYDLKADRDDPTAVGTKEFADAVIRRMRN